MKILILFYLLSNLLFSAILHSPRDIDIADIGYRMAGEKSLAISFIFTNKRTDSMVIIKNKRIYYDCNLYYAIDVNTKGHIIASKSGSVNGSYQSMYIDIPSNDYKHTNNAIMECKISIVGKSYLDTLYIPINPNATPLPLKKMEDENPIIKQIYPTYIKQQSIKETDEQRLVRLKKKYKNAPTMEMDDILILGINKLSYFRGKKNKILIESASGTFFFPTKKIKQAKFTNMSKKLDEILKELLK